MWQKFNVNGYIRYKPNDKTEEILRTNYDEAFKYTILEGLWEHPNLDEDGFVKMQLWDFMREFGPHLFLGCAVPFETEIEYATESN
jgi:hypothetical protein